MNERDDLDEGPRIRRLLTILGLVYLFPREWTRGDLARYFGVSERALDKDLRVLRDVGFRLRRRSTGYELNDEVEEGMPWEVFKQAWLSPNRAPAGVYVTIGTGPKAIMSVSAEGYAALGEPERVEMLFDRDTNRLAIRPHQGQGMGYRIHRRPNGAAAFTARGFRRYYGLNDGRLRRFHATLEDGMIVASLDEPLKGNDDAG